MQLLLGGLAVQYWWAQKAMREVWDRGYQRWDTWWNSTPHWPDLCELRITRLQVFSVRQRTVLVSPQGGLRHWPAIQREWQFTGGAGIMYVEHTADCFSSLYLKSTIDGKTLIYRPLSILTPSRHIGPQLALLMCASAGTGKMHQWHQCVCTSCLIAENYQYRKLIVSHTPDPTKRLTNDVEIFFLKNSTNRMPYPTREAGFWP